jgi:cobalt-zinc-cadmium efflux system membrane fusion protein
MTSHARGWAFLVGGVVLGLLFLGAVFAERAGLLGGHKAAPPETPLMVRQGNRIVVPEGSSLRDRLTVTPATTQPVIRRLDLPGIVEADPARTAAVLTPLAGRVLELKVALGDRVNRDQVLAIIDSPDLAQAYDDDDKAADTLALTEKNLARQEGQVKIGSGSQRDLDQARSDHAQAVSEHTRTQARLKAIGASADPKQRSHLLIVKAPVGGSVTNLAIAAGNMINDPSQPILTIADLSTIWVTALVPEKDLAVVCNDQEAQVRFDAYPGQVFQGKVANVSDVLESDSRRNKVRIVFPNRQHLFKPNMYASVGLAAPEEAEVVLPTSALLMNNDRTSVFVATAPWTFERRTVDAALEEGSSVAIRSGVAAGEQVVVKGAILLND